MRFRLRYLAVLASALACYAALGAVLRVLPPRVHDLGAGAATLGLAVGAPALAAIVARPLGGRVADRRGPLVVMLVGAVAMAAGVAPSFASSAGLLVASRLLVGAGEGAMMSAAVLWLLRLAGPERQGRALGHIGLANYGGLALGPLLSDALHGGEHPARVFLAAVALPVLGAGLAAALRAAPPPITDGAAVERPAGLVRATLRPGIGLMLINVGYVALISFGTAAVARHVAGEAAAIVPVFAAGVILARTAGVGVPDRFGARRTLAAASPAAAVGLAVVAYAPVAPAPLAGVAVLAVGQALAVPSLGLLALARVEPARHGAAAGLFFSWFDAGVGAGGPLVGLVAGATSAAGGLAAAAVAVAAAAPIALLSARRARPTRPRDGRAAPRGRPADRRGCESEPGRAPCPDGR